MKTMRKQLIVWDLTHADHQRVEVCVVTSFDLIRSVIVDSSKPYIDCDNFDLQRVECQYLDNLNFQH